jgi:uncharacterized protein (DUF58 family)
VSRYSNILARATQFAPSRRLGWLIAAAAPLWLLSSLPAGRAAAIAAIVVVIAAAGFDFVSMPAPDGIGVRRQFPASVGVGDQSIGRYTIESSAARPFTAELFDRLPGAIETSSTLPHEFTVPGGGAIHIDRPFTGVRRGDHELGPVAIRVRGTLGLLWRTIVNDPGGVIRGVPSIAQVRLFRLLSVQHRMRAAGVRAVRRRGEGRSFAGLREYAQGDDPRHIDWKATARRGKIIAREYSTEQGQQILIVVDAGRMMTQIAGSRPRFEYALSSALVLADIAAHSGDAVGVVVFDDVVRRYAAPAKGVGAVRAVRDALTAAEATLVEPDYAAAFRTIAARQRSRALVVVFTDVLDVRSSRTLIAHLALSTARHLPMVIALRNDDLTAAALPAHRSETGAIFEAAAAEELLTARELALAKMRAAGVTVVNVAPEAMTAAVVNRYLDIKARAAL